MDHLRIPGTEPSSVILTQTGGLKSFKFHFIIYRDLNVTITIFFKRFPKINIQMKFNI